MKNGFSRELIYIYISILVFMIFYFIVLKSTNLIEAHKTLMANNLRSSYEYIQASFFNFRESYEGKELSDTTLFKSINKVCNSKNSFDNLSCNEFYKNLMSVFPDIKIIKNYNYLYYFLDHEDKKWPKNANYYNDSALVLKNGNVILNYRFYEKIYNDKGLKKILGEGNSKYIAKFDLDVNGKSEPNVYGRDIFRFLLRNDGNIVPYMGTNINENCTKFSLPIYEDMEHKGLSCAAKIMNENWKMKY